MYQFQYNWFQGKKITLSELGFLLYLSSAFLYANCIVRWVPLVEAKWLLTMSDLHSHNLSTMIERVSKNSDPVSHWSRLDDMLIPEPMTVSLFG